MAEMRSISLPEELCQAAEQKLARGCQSLDEIVSELLQELLRDEALSMDEKEQRVIEERLKGLGYI